MELCENCGHRFESKGNKQKYCKDCAPVVHLMQMREAARIKREKEFAKCKAVRNKDGTINFTKEAKAVKHLLKFYGLRP